MLKKRHDERGQVLILTLLLIIPILGLVALVADLGLVYLVKERAQMAAESAAFAAVQAAISKAGSGGTFTCGSQGLSCQPATACPISYPTPLTSNLQNGCLFASANGFVNGGPQAQTVSIEANTGNPPTVSGLASGFSRYYVTVRIAQQNPLTFGRVFGGSFLPVSAQATASIAGTAPPDCITTLNASASSAFSVAGNAKVVLNSCSMTVNSSSSSALSVGGNASITASAVSVVGGYSSSGSIYPTPVTGVKPTTDPLINNAAPSYSSGCTQMDFRANHTVTLDPGVYCGGITLSGNGTVTFNSGTYVLLGGGLDVSGNVDLNGTGVMFYNTFDSTHNFGTLKLSGDGTLNLTAASSGVLYFEDRNAPSGNTDTITGNSGWSVTGAIYLPRNHLDITGNGLAASQSILVADSVSLVGNAKINLNPNSGSSPIAPQVKSLLLE